MNALVLAGGGGKGSYEIGVWSALREIGVEQAFSCVIGTSVGALNAALFAQGDLEEAISIWLSLTPGQILPANPNGEGALASQEGLKKILLRALTLRPDDPLVYVCCSRIIGGNPSAAPLGVDVLEEYLPEYICLNQLPRMTQVQYLLASAALPFAFDKVEIGGVYYRDGGIIDKHNLPYQEAICRGYDKILAVSLEQGVQQEFSQGNSKVMILRSSSSLNIGQNGVLDFQAKNAEKRIWQGYQDTISQKKAILDFLKSHTGLLTKVQERRIKACFQQRMCL